MERLLLILDGMTDDPQPSWENAAFSSTWGHGTREQLASQSQTGVFLTTPPGFDANSLTCILTLLGVPTDQLPRGRAYLEALALELPVKRGDCVFRCNLVEVDEKGRLADAVSSHLTGEEKTTAFLRAGREAEALGLHLHPIGDYRALLICPGEAFDLSHVPEWPPHQSVGISWGKTQDSLCRLSVKLSLFTDMQTRIFGQFPGVRLALWGASAFSPLFPLRERFGIFGAVVSATPVVLGMGKALGMDCWSPAGGTGDVDTNLREKLCLTQRLLESYDLVVLHINGADEAAHRKNRAEKLAFLQRVDRELLLPLVEALSPGGRLLLCSDHTTLSRTGEHRGDPQPFFLFEKGKNLAGSLGTLEGGMAIPLLMKE